MRILITGLLIGLCIQLQAQAPENCSDGIDNNNNGLWDCADPGCINACGDSAFVCGLGSEFVQIRNGNQLWIYDGEWIQDTDFLPRDITVNAVGYNTRDGFMYGIQAGTDANNHRGTNKLVRISRKGMAEIGTVSGLPLPGADNTYYHTGDFNQANGLLYVTWGPNAVMHSINVNTKTRVAAIPVVSPATSYGVADFTYLPATQHFYGLVSNSNILRRIDMSGNVTDYTLTDINGSACGISGAAFADANGDLYFYCNSSREFFKVSRTDETYSSFDADLMDTGITSASNNDGASCPFSRWPDPTPSGSCCEEVLEILEGMQPEERRGSSGIRQELDALKEELKSIKEERTPKAVLRQNRPNPFNERTYIEYEILDTYAGSASISVFNMNGVLHRTYPVPVKEQGQLIIEAGSLKPGMYLYTLIVDDQEADTKRMIMLD